MKKNTSRLIYMSIEILFYLFWTWCVFGSKVNKGNETLDATVTIGLAIISLIVFNTFKIRYYIEDLREDLEEVISQSKKKD